MGYQTLCSQNAHVRSVPRQLPRHAQHRPTEPHLMDVISPVTTGARGFVFSIYIVHISVCCKSWLVHFRTVPHMMRAGGGGIHRLT